jgi:endoglucanase
MDWTLLKQLSETSAVPGREEAVRARVMEIVRPLSDSVEVDIMGNVICARKGAGERTVMIAAHMDEIGFIVKYIDKDGFLRLQPLGGFDPRQLFAQRVKVFPREEGPLPGVLTYTTKPAHLLTAEESKSPPKLDQFFVDVGLGAKEVASRISIGDMVTMDRACVECGDCLVGKCLDNRVGVFVLIETLRRLKEHQVDVCAVFTVQEEVGLRGAATSSFAVNPDVSIALDTTLACDYPGPADSDTVTKLGEGIGIKIMDGSLICHPKLVEHFRKISESNKISHQMEILPRGGTDAGAMQRSRGGCASITLSVPTRYIHTVNEMIHRNDVEAGIDLLTRYLEVGHEESYEYT